LKRLYWREGGGKINIRKIFCYLGMHDWGYNDVRLPKNTIVSDTQGQILYAKDFKFPVYVHIKKCRICGKCISSHPDLPGSFGGKYKVHY